jgi:2,3-bisphosphoglycerate-independent phosphoglycerate mutase
MKHIIILGDGMADEPTPQLQGATPLHAAKTPAMDWLAQHGRQGELITVPDGYTPGSEIANLSVLGYDVAQVFEGRGSLEAASMGISIDDDEMAMRCNLICIQDGIIKNHSAGHITTEEATELITFLQQQLGNDDVHFFPGISYRHLLKIRHGNKRIHCTPPHDVPGTDFKSVLISAEDDEAKATANLINELIISSQKILATHPINLKRIAEGKDPANSIWPWSPGYKPSMQTMAQLFGINNGIVISAVDLIRGIGVYAGLKPIIVDGATGLYDTNYEGKAQAAIEALHNDCDFVFLHVEASDEAGHEGNVDLKIKTIEYLDNRIIAPIIQATKDMSEPVAIAVLPDHPTPCQIRTHTRKPVPFVIYTPTIEHDGLTEYDEFSAKNGGYGLITDGAMFIRTFLNA